MSTRWKVKSKSNTEKVWAKYEGKQELGLLPENRDNPSDFYHYEWLEPNNPVPDRPADVVFKKPFNWKPIVYPLISVVSGFLGGILGALIFHLR